MKIRLLPDHVEFEQIPSASLLDSALRAGIQLNHGCANGACGLCRARRIDGDLIKIQNHDATLSALERDQGVFLLCSYAAGSDVLIEQIEDSAAAEIRPQTIETRVRKVETLAKNTLVLSLRTPRSMTFHYHAGQRAQLTLKTHLAADLSVASCPCDPMNLQFHVHRETDPDLFEALLHIRPTEPVVINGPQGDFILRESAGRRLVFLAFDDGFAPIKSLLEHALSQELPQNVELVWIASPMRGHYLDNYCRALADALDNVRYWPVTLPESSDVRHFETTLLPTLDGLGRLDDTDLYVAAPAMMIDSIRAKVIERGLPKERLILETRPHLPRSL